MYQHVFFDEQYLTQLRSGDEDTAKHFVTYFRRSLRRWLWGKFSREQEEELIDTAIVSAYEKISQGQPRDASKLQAYVTGICVNLTRLALRPSANSPGAAEPLSDRTDFARSAEQLLLARERADEVKKVLASLSARDREILVDLFYRDKGRDEVCQKHGLDRNELRLVLFRARRRFQKGWQVQSTSEKILGSA